MKTFIGHCMLMLVTFLMPHGHIQMSIRNEQTLDSLGACQGVTKHGEDIFVYGDREVGVIRTYRLQADTLQYTGKECRLTVDGKDVISHPTGIAYNGKGPVFIGNSIRLNKEGTLWKAVIYCVNWNGLLKTGTLDGNIYNTIDDDACVQGTRPEYIFYKNKWCVATADYGGKNNEVRLYDPAQLARAGKTSAPGVLIKKFSCGPWVQNLHWIADKGIIVLIQNQVEGRRWRFTYVDLQRSIDTGQQVVIDSIDLGRPDELEGFMLLDDRSKGIAVSSSRNNNANMLTVKWP